MHCAHEVHKNLQRAAYDTQFAHPWPTFKILWMLKNSPSWDTQLGLNNFIFVHMQDNGNYIKPSYFLHQLWQQQITITYWRSFKNMNYAYISSKRKSTNKYSEQKQVRATQTNNILFLTHDTLNKSMFWLFETRKTHTADMYSPRHLTIVYKKTETAFCKVLEAFSSWKTQLKIICFYIQLCNYKLSVYHATNCPNW